jgi:hypothetical protein
MRQKSARVLEIKQASWLYALTITHILGDKSSQRVFSTISR